MSEQHVLIGRCPQVALHPAVAVVRRDLQHPRVLLGGNGDDTPRGERDRADGPRRTSRGEEYRRRSAAEAHRTCGEAVEADDGEESGYGRCVPWLGVLYSIAFHDIPPLLRRQPTAPFPCTVLLPSGRPPRPSRSFILLYPFTDQRAAADESSPPTQRTSTGCAWSTPGWPRTTGTR